MSPASFLSIPNIERLLQGTLQSEILASPAVDAILKNSKESLPGSAAFQGVMLEILILEILAERLLLQLHSSPLILWFCGSISPSTEGIEVGKRKRTFPWFVTPDACPKGHRDRY